MSLVPVPQHLPRDCCPGPPWVQTLGTGTSKREGEAQLLPPHLVCGPPTPGGRGSSARKQFSWQLRMVGRTGCCGGCAGGAAGPERRFPDEGAARGRWLKQSRDPGRLAGYRHTHAQRAGHPQLFLSAAAQPCLGGRGQASRIVAMLALPVAIGLGSLGRPLKTTPGAGRPAIPEGSLPFWGKKVLWSKGRTLRPFPLTHHDQGQRGPAGAPTPLPRSPAAGNTQTRSKTGQLYGGRGMEGEKGNEWERRGSGRRARPCRGSARPHAGMSLPWETRLHCPEGPGNRRPAALVEQRRKPSSRACGGLGQAGAWRRRGRAPPL